METEYVVYSKQSTVSKSLGSLGSTLKCAALESYGGDSTMVNMTELPQEVGS